MKKLNIFFITLALTTPFLAHGQADTAAKQANLDFATDFILKPGNEVLFQLTAPPEHHFNLEAPNKVVLINGKKAEEVGLEKKATKFFGSLKNGNKEESLKATLYVCDDKNTYCVPKTKEISLAAAFGPQKSIVKVNSPLILDSTPDKATLDIIKKQSNESLNAENEKDWIVDNVEKAFKTAKTKNRPLFIDFYGIWCPPCNVMDETFFKTEKFNPYKNRFVFLKLDVDKSTSWNLKQKYKVKGYPTYVLATSTGEEIHRVVGSSNVAAFASQIDLALKYKNLSLEKRIAMAPKKSKDRIFLQDIALNLYNLDKYTEATEYFNKAFAISKKDAAKYECKSFKAAQFAKLKTFSDDQKKEKLNFLATQLASAPTCTESFEISEAAQDLLEEANDKALTAKVLADSIHIGEKLLENESLLLGGEYTLGDVNITLAELYDKAGEKEKSKIYYQKSADLYDKEIQEGRVSADKERGVNLSKAYALNKVGRFNDAEQIYLTLIKTYPNEFTYYNSYGGALKENGKTDAAILQYKKSLDYAYGDNKLRVAASLAKLLIDAKKTDEAKALLTSVIQDTMLPEDKEIRTHSYYNKLVKLNESLKK